MNVTVGVAEMHPARHLAMQANLARTPVRAVDAEFETKYPLEIEAVFAARKSYAPQ